MLIRNDLSNVIESTRRKEEDQLSFTVESYKKMNERYVSHLSSASFIHLSNTGLIFCALLGVMSSFSNLDRTAIDFHCLIGVFFFGGVRRGGGPNPL